MKRQSAKAPIKAKPPKTAENISRLRSRSQFLYVQKGVKAVRPSVIVEARRRPQEGPQAGKRPGPPGAGFTATKKIGGAVIRNRARRRLKEAVRQLLPQHGLAGVDYVFVARAQTPIAPWAALLDDVGNALLSVRANLAAKADTKAESKA
ncbi:MAG: ribonuclease P protein component [Hyphomonadaceae bacterium]